MNVMGRNHEANPVETASAPGGNLFTQFNRYFCTVVADSPELREAAHALRFQVYCLERKFENAEEHPNGLEIDAYDDHAVQGVLIHRPTQKPMGAVRLIHTRRGIPDSLPVQGLLRANALELSDYVNLSQTIEISRFAISKEFRRRKSDETDASTLLPAHAGGDPHLAFLVLSQFLLRESVKRNILFWTAVMEPKLMRLLAMLGLCYTPIGPLVEHHGIRQPCYCYLPNVLERARRAHPQCWHVLTDGGRLHEALRSVTPKLAVA